MRLAKGRKLEEAPLGAENPPRSPPAATRDTLKKPGSWLDC